MTRRGSEIAINDFSGGLHTAVATTEVKKNEAYDLSNVVVGPGGDYLRTKYGNSAFNAIAMNGGANVQGLGYFKPISGNDHLVAICGAKVFESTSLDGTMNDITGAVTVTAGQNNIWTFLTFNNICMAFGGASTSPDAPIQYTGAGNAAALSGTPPSAYGAILTNNRVFSFRTAASPSIVQWSKLGDGQDWTATGSGSQTISTSDNDSVTAMAVMSNSVALIFKQGSVHKMITDTLVSGAFPVFPLFKNVGCAGKHAVVVADGLCYFITPQGEMRITDGEKVYDDDDLPALSNVDDLWAAGNMSRFEYVQGIRAFGPDYDHIVWVMTSTAAGTTNDVALVWDLKNKCWLRHKTGFKANVMVNVPPGTMYTGHYAGFIYKQDVSTLNTEASESSVNIDSYWMSGWNPFGSFEKVKTIQEAYISYVIQSSGNLNFSWGYDFNSLQRNEPIDQRSSGSIIGVFVIGVDRIGGQTDNTKRVFPAGNGSVFQYRFRNTDSRMKINSMDLIAKRAVGV